jgi:glutaredoxin
MARSNNQNIDRKTNKPNPKRTEGITNDPILNRAEQTRRDDDVIRTPKRTIYDIDYAIKWYIDNEIQPQIKHHNELVNVPVIFANGEKWDNVQRLGYIRDEKGMLQSPLIMIKRNTITERDDLKNLDVNRTQPGSKLIYKNRYNSRNRYIDSLFPIPTNESKPSEEIFLIDIPKYVDISYDLLIWCDFTTQINDVVDQMLPYNRFAWGNEANKFSTYMSPVTFETVNTVGEDRLVRATIPINVHGTLLSGQEARQSTIQKMYSIKKVRFDTVIDIGTGLFESTQVPASILAVSQQIFSGATVIAAGGGTATEINPNIMAYLVNLTDQQATVINSTTVTVNTAAAINPSTLGFASKNEFDVYINGQYIDKQVYTWTPSDTLPNTITFDTNTLGFTLNAGMVVIVNGRWA